MITGRERRRKPALPLWRVGGERKWTGERERGALRRTRTDLSTVKPSARSRRGGCSNDMRRTRSAMGVVYMHPCRGQSAKAGLRVPLRGSGVLRRFRIDLSTVKPADRSRMGGCSDGLRRSQRAPRNTASRRKAQTSGLRLAVRTGCPFVRVPSRFSPAAHDVPMRHHLLQKSPRAKIPCGGARVLYM